MNVENKFCPVCGKLSTPQELRSICFPAAKSFWRLVCTCGWFGPQAENPERCIERYQMNLKSENCENCKHWKRTAIDFGVCLIAESESKTRADYWKCDNYENIDKNCKYCEEMPDDGTCD